MPRKEAEPVTPEWMAVIEAALTEEVCRLALRYAWGRVELMKRADVVVQDNEAFALTNDAIADTMTRVRVWDPALVKLGTHLCGVIRSRTNARITRVRKLRHESIHEVDDNLDAPAEVEASLARDTERTRAEAAMSLTGVAGLIVERLRQAADADADVLAILSAYGDGVTERQEVTERLEWPLTRFVNARRRLDRLIRDLPADVREAAADSMRMP